MIFKGNFLYTPALGELTVREGEYLAVEGEKCAGFYRALPQEYAGQPVTDFGRALVLPAFCDLHLHAPQMVNRGVGYDQELLPWLETYTFPAEKRYADPEVSRQGAQRFLSALWAHGTTSAADFSGPTSGTVTFAAGETSKVLEVAVYGDDLGESDEQFTVQLFDNIAGQRFFAIHRRLLAHKLQHQSTRTLFVACSLTDGKINLLLHLPYKLLRPFVFIKDFT